ncbi:hypothetical protein CYMTET_12445, partial [Cymbomonas tetramitiformis]
QFLDMTLTAYSAAAVFCPTRTEQHCRLRPPPLTPWEACVCLEQLSVSDYVMILDHMHDSEREAIMRALSRDCILANAKKSQEAALLTIDALTVDSLTHAANTVAWRQLLNTIERKKVVALLEHLPTAHSARFLTELTVQDIVSARRFMHDMAFACANRVLCNLPPWSTSTIIKELPHTWTAAHLDDMDVTQAVAILHKLPRAKARAILGIIQPAAAGLVLLNMEEGKRKELMTAMVSSGSSGPILNSLEPAKAEAVLRVQSTGEVVQHLGSMSMAQAAALLLAMPGARALEVMRSMQVGMCAQLLGRCSKADAVVLLEQMPLARCAELLPLLPCATAASIMSTMEARSAGKMLGALLPQADTTSSVRDLASRNKFILALLLEISLADVAKVMATMMDCECMKILQVLAESTDVSTKLLLHLRAGQATRLLQALPRQQAATLLERAGSEKCADHLMLMPVATAAEVVACWAPAVAKARLDPLRTEYMASILAECGAKCPGLLLEVEIRRLAVCIHLMPRSVAVDLLMQMPLMRSAQILASLAANELTMDAGAQLLGQMDLQIATPILAAVDVTHLHTLFTRPALTPKQAAALLRLQATKLADQVLVTLSMPRVASILQAMGAADAKEIYGRADLAWCVEVIDAMETAAVAEVFAAMPLEFSTGIVNGLHVNAALELVQRMAAIPHPALGVLAATFQALPMETACFILQRMEVAQAGAILRHLHAHGAKMHEIIAVLPVERACSLLVSPPPTRPLSPIPDQLPPPSPQAPACRLRLHTADEACRFGCTHFMRPLSCTCVTRGPSHLRDPRLLSPA